MATTQESTIAELAKNVFSFHVVTQELNEWVYRSWRCKRPNRGAYSFRVVTWPGCVYIGGDIRDFVFERECDMIPWLRSAVNSPQYLADKCIAGECYELSPDQLRQWLCEQISDDQGITEDRRDAIQELIDDEFVTIDKCYESGLFDEVPRCREFTPGFQWAVEAFKWFLANAKF